MATNAIITDVGLDRAAQANEKGVSITIGKFVLGSAYGYTPLVSDTKIHGDYLYESNPVDYKYVGDKTVRITCTVPQEIGPFQWGEVGIYLDTGELFALIALPQLQSKYSSIENDLSNTLTFYCYLTLSYSNVSITLDYGESPLSIVEIIDAYKFSSVKLPSETDQTAQEVIIHEVTPNQDSTLLVRSTQNRWTVASGYHTVYSHLTPVISTTNYLEFDASSTSRYAPNKRDAVDAQGVWLAQFADGTFCTFRSVEYIEDSKRLRFYYAEVLDTPRAMSSTELLKCNDPLYDYPYTFDDISGTINYDMIVGAPTYYGGVPIGGMCLWPINSTPDNYIQANGAALSRTNYAELFRVYGTTFGAGDGSSTFNIPDMRNYYPIGAGSRVSIGSAVSDGLPGITGRIYNDFTKHPVSEAGRDASSSGALYFGTFGGNRATDTNFDGGAARSIDFDASRSSAVYGRCSWVRPQSRGLHYIIRYR